MIRVAPLFPAQPQGTHGGDGGGRKRPPGGDGPPGVQPDGPPDVVADDDKILKLFLEAVEILLRERNPASNIPKKARGKQCGDRAEQKLDHYVENIFRYHNNPKPALVQLRLAAQAAASRAAELRMEPQRSTWTPQAIVKRIVELIQNDEDSDDEY